MFDTFHFTDFYIFSTPPVPVPYLILYIIIGVILVTIAVEVLAAEIINHIHYMGRHVSKARKITRKFYKMACAMDVRRGFNSGLMQIESFIRFGLVFGMMKTDSNDEQNVLAPYDINSTFEPISGDIKFADDDLSDRLLHVDRERQQSK
ncbi:unnamed protein product [Wuchereria bancrofti]|uniref:Uncharacterized protein n=1 Tax=Wuchereria bancrofti TaxID=6293 RepID=A0A3P7E166_WUCBA|nr:unnamed protein product [Wuchereria bancrofti]